MKAPSNEDYNKLRSTLIEALSNKALKEFRGTLNGGQRFFPNTTVIDRVISENQKPAGGIPGGKVRLTIKAQISAWFIYKDDERSLAKNILDTNFPEGNVPVEGTIQIIPAVDAQKIGDDIPWRISASQMVTQPWKQDQSGGIAVKYVNTARKLLQSTYQLESTPIIQNNPSLWLYISLLTYHIGVYQE